MREKYKHMKESYKEYFDKITFCKKSGLYAAIEYFYNGAYCNFSKIELDYDGITLNECINSKKLDRTSRNTLIELGNRIHQVLKFSGISYNSAHVVPPISNSLTCGGRTHIVCSTEVGNPEFFLDCFSQSQFIVDNKKNNDQSQYSITGNYLGTNLMLEKLTIVEQEHLANDTEYKHFKRYNNYEYRLVNGSQNFGLIINSSNVKDLEGLTASIKNLTIPVGILDLFSELDTNYIVSTPDNPLFITMWQGKQNSYSYKTYSDYLNVQSARISCCKVTQDGATICIDAHKNIGSCDNWTYDKEDDKVHYKLIRQYERTPQFLIETKTPERATSCSKIYQEANEAYQKTLGTIHNYLTKQN